MPVTTQETIESLQTELGQIAERQAALKLNPGPDNLERLKNLDAQYQQLSQRLNTLQNAQRSEKF